MWKYFHKLYVSKLKIAKKNNIQRSHFKDLNRKYIYVRYADNFIIFVWGTGSDCKEIITLVKTFLKKNLDLHLSSEKNKITYLKKEKVEFLGFQLWQSPLYISSKLADVNPIGKKDRIKKNLKFRAAIMQVPRLKITFSMTKVLVNLINKGMLRHKQNKIFPTSYKLALQYDIANIVLLMTKIKLLQNLVFLQIKL
jgi:hypothetical protein